MKFSILSVILWSRQEQLKPRIVPFETGMVNVISGSSRTGKSAIIPVIDYCLGSERCTIPQGTIRQACSWFGILVQTDHGQKLFARREPGEQRATNEMYVAEGLTLTIPESAPSKNATLESVKGQLDLLSGLTNLDFDPTPGGFNARPSFRDMMAFTFQPQNVVANPNVLFYRADSFIHREKLQKIFPYVLGAVTADLLAKRHELEQLKAALRRKQQELDSSRNISQRFLAQMNSHLDRAREYGLIGEGEGVGVDQFIGIAILRAVVERSKTNPTGAVSGQSISGSSAELVALRAKEIEDSTQLAIYRQRFVEMTELRKNSVDYRASLNAQRDRLGISSWLKKKLQDDHDCPVCGNDLNQPEEKLDTLINRLKEIEDSASRFQALPESLDREYQRVRAEMELQAETLAATQLRLRALRDVSEQEKRLQYTEISVSRYIGRLEADLDLLSEVGQDSELQAEVDDLARRVTALQSEVNAGAIRARTDQALKKIAGFSARILTNLDVERPNDPMTLSISDLSVKVDGDGREDFLWEIGSGSNWLSYHIALSLALQDFFCDESDSPVPQFLVYDQPSQVYFPQRLAERKEEVNPEKTELDPVFEDEDVKAVSKVFSALSRTVDENKGKLQIIVLDHAAERVWQDIPNIHYVEEWRNGVKLVPSEWLPGGSSTVGTDESTIQP